MDLMGSRGIKQLKESKPYKRINRQESGEKWAELKWRVHLYTSDMASS